MYVYHIQYLQSSEKKEKTKKKENSHPPAETRGVLTISQAYGTLRGVPRGRDTTVLRSRPHRENCPGQGQTGRLHAARIRLRPATPDLARGDGPQADSSKW
jgi:hypothetical protein